MYKCKNCGVDMRIGWKRKRTYCSDECRKAYHSTRIVFNCLICGNKLKGQQRQYCSDECKKKGKSKLQHERNKSIYKSVRIKSKVQHKPKMTVDEVVIKAREEGLTYGQYVAKYRL